MVLIVITALLLSSIIYLYIGFSLGRYNKGIGDLFPVIFGKHAKVNTVGEFSTSTVATTVSLATIIIAYFELAGYFGIFLLWTAITTAIGMLIVSIAVKTIWKKMSVYDHRPTMHEFLGVEFNSKTVSLVASACTSIGFLLIFATELIVGSRFLAKFIPEIPEWITVLFLSGVGFIYTLFGGFRAVIKTDQLQMKLIWGLIIILSGYYIYYIFKNGGLQISLSKVPDNILNFSNRDGLIVFLIGIAIMNIPTHISNMSIWQRISGAQQIETVVKGFKRSVFTLFASWTLLSLLACFAYMIVQPENSQNLLSDLLISISSSFVGKFVLFFVVLGLYGAMLSTASTNLIVVTHTISEDIVAKFNKSTVLERIKSKRDFNISRIILILSALVAVFLVVGLKYLGFSIADLVFAIYGGALALFPLIILALYNKRNLLKKISLYATIAVISGFSAGWGSAIYGKIIGNGNLIFLSPTISISISFIILLFGLIIQKNRIRKI